MFCCCFHRSFFTCYSEQCIHFLGVTNGKSSLPADMGRLHLSETRRLIVPAPVGVDWGVAGACDTLGSWELGVSVGVMATTGDVTTVTAGWGGAVVRGIEASLGMMVGVWKVHHNMISSSTNNKFEANFQKWRDLWRWKSILAKSHSRLLNHTFANILNLIQCNEFNINCI